MSPREWFNQHVAGHGPHPVPASPAPFEMGTRVTVSPCAVDAMFIGGAHGEVIAVEPNTDGNPGFGPWIISVELDNGLKLAFDAAELTLEAFAAHGEVPDLDLLKQQAREIQHEGVDLNSPIYDQVVQAAMAVDGFAASVEADLKAYTEAAS